MTAPRWIHAALDAVCQADTRMVVSTVDADDLATALLERLPLEALANAVPSAVVANVVRVLGEDHDVVTIAELYQGATRALDAAGAPYAVNTAEVYRPLDLVGRIRWLAEQRPTRLDLQRVEVERDAWHRRYDECIVTITANQQSIASLIEESETRKRERDRARATVADLTEQRAATERALTRTGAPMDELANEQGVVWLHRELDALKERLLKAETERDALRELQDRSVEAADA